jgi:hypothetical protein
MPSCSISFEQVARVTRKTGLSFRERIDRLSSTPVGGLVAIVGFAVLHVLVSFLLGDIIAASSRRRWTR